MNNLKAIITSVAVGLLVIAGIVLATQLTAMSYASLKSTLRAQGATIQDDGIGSQPFLAGKDYRLLINGVGVDVFEYRTTIQATYDSSRISADGTTIHGGFGPAGGQAAAVDFIAPPHWFHAGRVIVLYVGTRHDLVQVLRQALGPQFSGGNTSG